LLLCGNAWTHWPCLGLPHEPGRAGRCQHGAECRHTGTNSHHTGAISTSGKGLLYGSRAKGNFKPGSDIDLTLRGEGLTLSLLGDIDAALDDLLLPYEIDLSIYEQLDHAELVAHIDRVGRVIYQKSQTSQI